MDHKIATSLPTSPVEITIEVILRLPVKALLQFRAVCKDWCIIIDSKNFLHKHLSRSIENEMDRNIIIEGKNKSGLFSIDLVSLEETVELNVRSWWPEDRWHGYHGVGLCSSCNGLLCLWSHASDIALWNPSTMKHLLLPRMSFDDDLQMFDEYESSFNTTLGFGFDYASDDYKVVNIKEHYDCDSTFIDTEVKVYSLRSNSWKRVNGFPKEHRYLGNSVFVRDSLHWLVLPVLLGPSCHYSIVAYRLATEEIQIIPIPSSTIGSISEFVLINVIEGCLSTSFFERDVGFDLWILKEYGLEDSWTKLISIHDPNLVSCYQLVPLFYSKNVEILLIAESNDRPSKFYWHNFESKSTKEVTIRGLPENFWGGELLVESLVGLDCGCH